ncbi:MAG: hypothetical protein QOC92_447 [Acidimicrobiaceae bacterium]|jgi:hypothetical protein
MNIEQEISETLCVYRDSTPGSIEVWDRIEARIRRRRPALRWVAVGVVAAALAVVGGVTLNLQREGASHQVAAAAPTLEGYIDAANRSCAELRPKLDEARVVFPTATGYGVVAGQLVEIARTAMAQVEAFPVPESLRGSVPANRSDVRAALDDAEQAGRVAQEGDLTTAQIKIDSAIGALNRVGVRLANDGAETCRP